MLNRDQIAAIWDAIRALPADNRPKQVLHAFDLVLLNVRQDTGEVMLTRDQFAQEMGCPTQRVSTAMGTLERMGVIRSEHHKTKAMLGFSMVVYFVNPHVAWNGSLDVRKAEAPTLTLIEGGKNA